MVAVRDDAELRGEGRDGLRRRVVFNHTPAQTVAAFAPQFRVIPHGHH